MVCPITWGDHNYPTLSNKKNTQHKESVHVAANPHWPRSLHVVIELFENNDDVDTTTRVGAPHWVWTALNRQTKLVYRQLSAAKQIRYKTRSTFTAVTNGFCSYQVIRLSSRKSVNKYVYLYLYGSVNFDRCRNESSDGQKEVNGLHLLVPR